MILTRTKHIVAAIMAVTAGTGAQALEITVSPGSLCENIPQMEITSDAVLKLRGGANVTDLALLYKMSPAITTLDMSALNIIPYQYANTGYMDRLKFGAYELVPNMLAGTEVTRVVLPESLQAIGDQAFALSKIEEIEIPARVKSVGDYAFAGCTGLKKVTFQGCPEKLGKGIFRNCVNLGNVEFKEGLKHVPEGMFYGCKALQGMPAGAETVGDEAFRLSGIVEADLRGVSEVGAYAFADARRLTQVQSDGPVLFGAGAFAGDDALENVPELAGNAGQALAAGSGNMLTKRLNTPVIGEAAFANNKRITLVSLGPDVKEIKAHAFRNDTGINTVNAISLGSSVPALDPNGFSGLEADDGRYPIELLVNSLHADKWKSHDVWSRFNIRETSTGDAGLDPDNRIMVSRDGGTVTVSGAMPFDNVRVAGVSGVTYYDGGRGRTEISVAVPAGEIAVVTVLQGGVLKIVKQR